MQKLTTKMRIERQRLKLVKKKNARELRNTKEEGTNLPWMRIGNRDFGCPYRGKDRFSGQWKKFADRSYKERKDDGTVVTVVMPYQNNKYGGTYAG